MDISTQNKNLSLAEEKEVAILLKGKERFIPIPIPYRDRLQLLVDSVKRQIRSPEEQERARMYYQRIKETSAYKRKQKRKRKVKENYLYLKNREKNRKGNFEAEGNTRAYLYEQWLRSHRGLQK